MCIAGWIERKVLGGWRLWSLRKGVLGCEDGDAESFCGGRKTIVGSWWFVGVE